MCDYSLCGLPNRLAVKEEELITHRFRTGSIGLATPKDVQTEEECKKIYGLSGPHAAPAICVPPGSRLVVQNMPWMHRWMLNAQCGQEVVFVQLDPEINKHRDSIQFPNGRTLLLKDIPEGILFKVLSVTSQERSLFDSEMHAPMYATQQTK